MATEILMPKLGLTMTEGTIEQWFKNEGEAVAKGEVLFSVATDKLTNDVEADAAGVLLEILAAEGDTVECKSVIGYIGAPGEKTGGAAPSAAAPAAAPVAAETAPAAVPASTAKTEGGFVLATPYARKLAKEKGVDVAEIPATGYQGVVVAKDVAAYEPGSRVKTTPVAAKMAAELGIDVAALGADGHRVNKADVAAAVSPAAAPTAASLETAGEDKKVKVGPMRRAIAANMAKSWTTSPRVTFTRPVDATAMKDLRTKLNAGLKDKGVKLSYNHIIMKVCAKALTEYPEINASFADNILTLHSHVNMGLAVAKADGGLVVPNLKDCDQKSLFEIAAETDELIADAKAGKLGMDDMTGGTFTITNLGSYGLTAFSPIINQPELAILGVCAMVDTPVVVDGQIVVRPIMNLSLTADHRVVDGVQAAAFLQRIDELLENPILLLA